MHNSRCWENSTHSRMSAIFVRVNFCLRSIQMPLNVRRVRIERDMFAAIGLRGRRLQFHQRTSDACAISHATRTAESISRLFGVSRLMFVRTSVRKTHTAERRPNSQSAVLATLVTAREPYKRTVKRIQHPHVERQTKRLDTDSTIRESNENGCFFSGATQSPTSNQLQTLFPCCLRICMEFSVISNSCDAINERRTFLYTHLFLALFCSRLLSIERLKTDNTLPEWAQFRLFLSILCWLFFFFLSESLVRSFNCFSCSRLVVLTSVFVVSFQVFCCSLKPAAVPNLVTKRVQIFRQFSAAKKLVRKRFHIFHCCSDLVCYFLKNGRDR